MLLSWILATTLGACAAAADDFPAPTQPKLTYLYTLEADLSPSIDVGVGIHGERVAIPIIGGTFKGPRIEGTVLNLGADWGLVDGKGTFHPDTRYNLRTCDGANIFIQTSGSAQANGKIYLRMIYETGSEKYYWLNDVVAVGVLTAGNNSVTIEGWTLDL